MSNKYYPFTILWEPLVIYLEVTCYTAFYTKQKKPAHLVCVRDFTSVMSDSVRLWTIVLQAPLSVGFSRQEHLSGLPCPLSGDLPSPGTEPESPVSPALAGRFFTTPPPAKPYTSHMEA